MSSNETLTITLTGRAPVQITKSEWPILASSSGHDGQIECQANRTWSVKVRQHDDGRAIVYGIYSSAYQNEAGLRRGKLLDAGDDIIRTIYSVAASIGRGCSLAEDVIADLPAETL